MLRITRVSLSFLLVILIANFAVAATETDELDAKQKKLQADIEHSLVAPCCWNMTVDQHDSPKSRAVRTKIFELLKEGKSKKEILSYFSSKPEYGERILASPSQDTLLGKSAYWLIPIAILMGAFLVVGSLKKWSSSEGQNVTKGIAEDKPENSSFAAKVEEDLKDLE